VHADDGSSHFRLHGIATPSVGKVAPIVKACVAEAKEREQSPWRCFCATRACVQRVQPGDKAAEEVLVSATESSPLPPWTENSG